jgi:hypothetical protein
LFWGGEFASEYVVIVRIFALLSSSSSADFVEPSLSLLKLREQRWRLTTIRDHTRKIANFGLQFFALLSRCPEVRAHALHFLFELPFEFGQGGHHAEI